MFLFLLVFAALVTLAVPIAFRELIDAGLSDESVDKNFAVRDTKYGKVEAVINDIMRG